MLAFGILGPLQVTVGGGALNLGGTKQRALLAALLLERDRVVARDRLVDVLWGERPPASAVNSIHIYVSKLRRLLDVETRGNGSVLRTEPPGYVLRVEASAVDATAFERLLANGKQSLGDGAWGEAESILARALALWRGPALADLAHERFFEPVVARLDQMRLDALTSRVEALLGSARHAEALAELETLVAEHPLEERVRALLMLAFYQAGRQQEALETYRAFRDRLAEDLGLEPTPDLRKLELAILRQEVSLGPTALAARLGAAVRLVPSTRGGTNLPIPSTPIVGRARELAETVELLAERRLLTLTGTGGSGKTRLALELATTVAGRFPDGVFWVPLQALRNPAIVENVITTAVGADGPLAEHIGNKQMLVLLDNFEQVVAAAPIISAVVAQAPNARFVVTSRQPLDVEPEHRYEVEPLPEADAVELFCQRATRVLPAFTPTPIVDEICRRLDGLPLAVELAAARVVVLKPDELFARLERRLPLLTSGFRDAPERQRTLRNTIAWSYELLDSSEQELFGRLGVFRGSFSIEAAEAICGAKLDPLESLVIKSLLRRTGSDRLAMLDTIREYALERLGECDAGGATRRRHAEFFLDLAETANLNPNTYDPTRPMRHDVVRQEQDELYGALGFALETASVTLGLRLANAVGGWLWSINHPEEGVRYFDRLLEQADLDAVPAELLADSFREYGAQAFLAGDHAHAERLTEQSLALYEQLGDEHGRAVMLHRLGINAIWVADVDRARVLVEESHAIHERRDDQWGVSQTLGALGAIARESDDEALAYDLFVQSASIARDIGGGFAGWWAIGAAAEAASLSLRAGRLEDAEARAREALALADELRYRAGRVFGVGLLAAIAAARDQVERASLLWTAIEHEDAVTPLGGWRRHRRELERIVERRLGEPWRPSPDEISRLPLDDAVSLALQ